jgi:hypothetical protein
MLLLAVLYEILKALLSVNFVVNISATFDVTDIQLGFIDRNNILLFPTFQVLHQARDLEDPLGHLLV